MTPKELFTRLQEQIQAMVWGSTSNLIFGESVYVCIEIPIEQLSRWRTPCAFIVDLGASIDNEHPGLLIQSFSINIFVQNVSSAFSEGVLLSANRTADTSQGAGLLAIEDDFLDQMIKIIAMTTKIMLVEKGAAKPVKVKSNYPLITRAFSFQALVSVY